MRLPTLLLFLAAVILGGCTDAQVDQARTIVEASDKGLAQAEAVLRQGQQAVAAAKALAEVARSEQALAAVAKAEAALVVVSNSVAVAKDASAAARAAYDTAKAAQDAGGSTIDVVIGVIATLVPAAGGILMALRRASESTRAFRQTVNGLDEARSRMTPEAWKSTVAPALASAQDERVKAMVDRQQA